MKYAGNLDKRSGPRSGSKPHVTSGDSILETTLENEYAAWQRFVKPRPVVDINSCESTIDIPTDDIPIYGKMWPSVVPKTKTNMEIQMKKRAVINLQSTKPKSSYLKSKDIVENEPELTEGESISYHNTQRNCPLSPQGIDTNNKIGGKRESEFTNTRKALEEIKDLHALKKEKQNKDNKVIKRMILKPLVFQSDTDFNSKVNPKNGVGIAERKSQGQESSPGKDSKSKKETVNSLKSILLARKDRLVTDNKQRKMLGPISLQNLAQETKKVRFSNEDLVFIFP